jgi:hypothetical protein
MFYFSHQWQRCHNYEYFDQHIEIFWEKSMVYQLFICLALIPIRIGRLWIHTLASDPGPDRPDPDPTKLCGSDPIRIHRSAVPGTVDYWFTFSIFLKIVLIFEFNFLFEAPLGQVTPVFLPITKEILPDPFLWWKFFVNPHIKIPWYGSWFFCRLSGIKNCFRSNFCNSQFGLN